MGTVCVAHATPPGPKTAHQGAKYHKIPPLSFEEGTEILPSTVRAAQPGASTATSRHWRSEILKYPEKPSERVEKFSRNAGAWLRAREEMTRKAIEETTQMQCAPFSWKAFSMGTADALHSAPPRAVENFMGSCYISAQFFDPAPWEVATTGSCHSLPRLLVFLPFDVRHENSLLFW